MTDRELPASLRAVVSTALPTIASELDGVSAGFEAGAEGRDLTFVFPITSLTEPILVGRHELPTPDDNPHALLRPPVGSPGQKVRPNSLEQLHRSVS